MRFVTATKILIYSTLLSASATLFSGVVTTEREVYLSNVTQLTNPGMGFEKAGEAYFSPDSKKIIFQAVPDGYVDYKIYTMDLETNKVCLVSGDAKACTCSFFRPDGKKIIFGASPEHGKPATAGNYKWDFTPFMNVYEANPDGTEAVALTQGPAYHAECAYSSDGEHIVYASNESGCMNIYVMKSDGTDVRQVTHSTDCYNGGPFFSPDNKSIIFRADRVVPDRLQIYMMDSDGDNLVQLTDNNAVNWAPFWHPSGKYIAYTTSIHGHYNYEIYLLSIDTGKEYRVTHHAGFDGLPTFNSDGTKILWTSKRGEDNTSQVYIADFTFEENINESINQIQ